ncbi:DUF397 domain-containing protein [Nocardiopsis sp. RSe5-2]|uniref:DUF397 domain-containing protein n=1 Tax=Nocardiopsis endophytica TaxID=3018445 RepID=A0ABT4U5F7_9ACTN|nr:DUF397 domain-containing protein [Nocardiopsis endophytica]MDA2812185.1 DUF397 domain-containing protein [Nocardiopsis endophytica]
MPTERWHKSSYSGASSSCVEVSEGLRTAVRDSRYRHLGHLDFPADEWARFLYSLKGGFTPPA